MNDRDFLYWIHERLQNVYHEDPLIDHMHKLRDIIASTPTDKISPNQWSNSLDELKSQWRKQQAA